MNTKRRCKYFYEVDNHSLINITQVTETQFLLIQSATSGVN